MSAWTNVQWDPIAEWTKVRSARRCMAYVPARLMAHYAHLLMQSPTRMAMFLLE